VAVVANNVQGKPGGVNAWGYVEGGPELAKKLQALGKSVRDDLLVQATEAAARVIADEWTMQIATKIGYGPGTAHYIEAVGVRSRPGVDGATAWVGLPLEVPLGPGEDHPRDYAPRLEFGHYAGGIQQAPRPTLRPAYEATRVKATDTMATKIKALIEKVAALS
jgi:HK97 gp10 family phage protein